MTETSWHSYPKVYSLGHSALAELLLDDVIVEEKVDGSQFSFGRFGDTLRCRSKGQEILIDHPEKQFAKAVATAKELAPLLQDGWTYRGEYLQKPRHNTQTHERVPAKHVIIFDVQSGHERYLSYEDKCVEAARLGLEVVPRLFSGRLEEQAILLDMLSLNSVLGGCKIEGVVIKNYRRFGADGKALMGKHVSEEFKEIHGKLWKAENPGSGDIIQNLVLRFKTEARWKKAAHHLRDGGKLTDTPKDIGPLVKEIQDDVMKECGEEIRLILFNWAWSKVARAIVSGAPQWYKEQLLKRQFDQVG
jgi:hypothetical protein